MTKRTFMPIVLPGAATVALALLHFMGREPAPVQDAPPAPAVTATPSPAAAQGAARDAALWQNRRDELMPSLMDTDSTRDEKTFYKRMKVLGSSPVELVGVEGLGHAQLMIAKGIGDLDRFLASGGHFSGPIGPARARMQAGKKP